MFGKGNIGPGGGPTLGPVGGQPKGTMMQKMIAKAGPIAGKKEFFSTLQKQGKLKKTGIVKGPGMGKSF
jgi:hypothetical protein